MSQNPQSIGPDDFERAAAVLERAALVEDTATAASCKLMAEFLMQGADLKTVSEFGPTQMIVSVPIRIDGVVVAHGETSYFIGMEGQPICHSRIRQIDPETGEFRRPVRDNPQA
jgi:hypothetical protein